MNEGRPRTTMAPRPSARQLLNRILDQPGLCAAVQGLPPSALARLIDHIGLEDSGELIALATTEQLKKVFDEDLWKSDRPGQDETFDVDRFMVWLEILLEAGEQFAAHKVAELSADLFTVAVHRHALVLDLDEVPEEMTDRSEDFLVDKALDSCLSFEFGEYQLVSRTHDGWDALITVLAALDKEHHDVLQRTLVRCCHMSSEVIEESGGLLRVLKQDEMLEQDAAAEREDRRSEHGYIAPSTAASFLALARVTPLDQILAQTVDPVARASFRAFDTAASVRARTQANAPHAASQQAPQGRDTARLVEVLQQAQVLPSDRRSLLLQGDRTDTPDLDAPFRAVLHDQLDRDAKQYDRTVEELAFVSNALVAGCSFAERSLRPLEAAEAVMAVCNLGLEHLGAQALIQHSAITVFKVGWHLLYENVVLASSRALAGALAKKIKSVKNKEAIRQLKQVEQAMLAAIQRGKPWQARGRIEAHEFLFEEPGKSMLLALLDELPTLTGDLATGPHLGRAHAYIATGAQVQRVQAFLKSL
ncbi:MAG: DUF6178 family protein [Pseudomonadota bacterium]